MAGAALSFVPVVGNALGATVGTIGTVGNLAADMMDDSVSSSEAWRNLGINAGMTGLMLVPGGGVVKGAKALVGLGTLGLGAYNVLSNVDRIKELNAKKDAGKLSRDEERELNAYKSMASGAITGVKGFAGQAAHVFGNNIAGKSAAFISDPITGAAAALGNKRASASLAGMTAKTVSPQGKTRGKDFVFSDGDGNEIRVSSKQRQAMEAAFKNAIKQDGATGTDINRAVGEAWAKAGTPEQ